MRRATMLISLVERNRAPREEWSDYFDEMRSVFQNELEIIAADYLEIDRPLGEKCIISKKEERKRIEGWYKTHFLFNELGEKNERNLKTFLSSKFNETIIDWIEFINELKKNLNSLDAFAEEESLRHFHNRIDIQFNVYELNFKDEQFALRFKRFPVILQFFGLVDLAYYHMRFVQEFLNSVGIKSELLEHIKQDQLQFQVDKLDDDIIWTEKNQEAARENVLGLKEHYTKDTVQGFINFAINIKNFSDVMISNCVKSGEINEAYKKDLAIYILRKFHKYGINPKKRISLKEKNQIPKLYIYPDFKYDQRGWQLFSLTENENYPEELDSLLKDFTENSTEKP